MAAGTCGETGLRLVPVTTAVGERGNYWGARPVLLVSAATWWLSSPGPAASMACLVAFGHGAQCKYACLLDGSVNGLLGGFRAWGPLPAWLA